MGASVRLLFCCLCCAVSVLASSPEEINASEAVLEDFLNKYGDKPGQNALGAAKGVIENGKGKAYVGEGYWFPYCDKIGSTIQNGAGVDITDKNFDAAIDSVGYFVHLKMKEKDTTDKSYVGFGCNLLKEGTYCDLSKMTAITVEAKGTGTVRLNMITKDYLDGNADWGYYGADLVLGADFKATAIPKADLVPLPYSFGAPDGDVELTWAASGSKAVTQVKFDLAAGKSAEIYIKKITFTGMIYSDFGFIPLSVSFTPSAQNLRNNLMVNNALVTYSITQPQNLSIGLFNAMGGKVATLFSGNAEAGSHVVPMNLQSQNVANGNYFVVLTGERSSVSRPLTIVK